LVTKEAALSVFLTDTDDTDSLSPVKIHRHIEQKNFTNHGVIAPPGNQNGFRFEGR
jgi:hypothetical protein